MLFYERLLPRGVLLQNQLIIFIQLTGLSSFLQCCLLVGKVYGNLSLIIGLNFSSEKWFGILFQQSLVFLYPYILGWIHLVLSAPILMTPCFIYFPLVLFRESYGEILSGLWIFQHCIFLLCLTG
jgi:hypothetical protein